MRFFDDKLSLVILMLTIPLLFLPKINLISIAERESAGLRIDDMILFVIGILFMWSHALSHQQIYKIEGYVLWITGLSFVSFFFNRFFVSLDLLSINAKIFYSVRLVEYFIFFYIGALTSYYFKGTTIIRAFFLWNVFIMILQKMNLAGAVTVEGYYGDVSTRVLGVASFPSEMGLLLNLLFCYMVWNPTASSQFLNLFQSPLTKAILKSFYLYWMFIFFGIFIIFTGNRISIVALIICFVCRLFQTFKLKSIGSLLTIFIAIPILFASIGFLISRSEGVYERSADLFSLKNLELFKVVWSNTDISRDLFGEGSISTENYDLSWWIRIHKWIYAAKSYLSHPECYLQGLGPGFSQAALDGGLLRILTEFGLIGTFLYCKFFGSLFRLNSQMKWMTISFLINMIFFDAYLAYKTMSVFLFASGYIFETNHRKLSVDQEQSSSLCQDTITA